MIYERQDFGDRLGSHIPITVFIVDDLEFDSVIRRLDENHMRIRVRENDLDEDYFVLCWSPQTNFVFQTYSVIGGDIMFRCRSRNHKWLF